MGDRPTEPVPTMDWEYALSAADELVLWHLATDTEEGQARAVRECQAHVVVLVAAAVHDRAVATGLVGAGIAQVELAEVLQGLRHHAASLLEAAPATAGLGAEQREELLADYDSDAFAVVRAAGERVVARHMADGGTTLAGRAAAMAAERRARRLRQLENGADDEL
ncbi:hypothetical protein [Streptomyces sp. KR80]|uniref:hypothetical protein n=1 Tax=Streptomyces sp. KR80 TaxID=3457426 RepID=UPI003FCF4EB0